MQERTEGGASTQEGLSGDAQTQQGGNQQSQQQTQQQPDGTQTQPKQTEQPRGEDSGSFTTVRRDQLPPELQQKWDDMNRDYTRKTQALASERSRLEALRDQASIGQYVMTHPELRPIVRKVASGVPFNEALQGNQMQGQQTTDIPEVDPEKDPVGFIKATVRGELKEVLGEYISPLREDLGQFKQYVQTGRVNAEYESLCAKYPLARDIGLDTINYTKSQYQLVDGSPISMEDAYLLIAKENPAILMPPPTGGQTAAQAGTPKNPPVERGGARTATGQSTTERRAVQGVRALQQKVAEIIKAGEMNEEGFARRYERRLADELSE